MTDNHLKPAFSFVVYDSSTGDVLHTHHVGVARGALLPGGEEIVRAILEHAALAAKREPQTIACLEVKPETLSPRTSYRVDVAAQRLIELAREK